MARGWGGEEDREEGGGGNKTGQKRGERVGRYGKTDRQMMREGRRRSHNS